MFYKGNLSTAEELSSRKSQLIDSSPADAVFLCSARKLIPEKQFFFRIRPEVRDSKSKDFNIDELLWALCKQCNSAKS